MPEEPNSTERVPSTRCVVAIAAALVSILLVACGPASRPVALSNAENAALNGDFERAESLLESVRFTPGIEDQLADANARINGYREVYAGVDRELEAILRDHGQNQAIPLMRERANASEAAGRTLEATIWRRRMGHLDAFVAKLNPKDPEWKAPEVAQDSQGIALVAERVFDAREVDELVKQGRYRDAIDLLRRLMVSAGENANQLRDRLWAIEEQGKAAIETITQKAEEIEKAQGGDAALAYLVREGERFPQFGPLGGVEQARRRLLKALGRSEEITWGPGMAPGIREAFEERERDRERKTPKDSTADAAKPAPVDRESPSSSDDGDDAGLAGGESGSRWRARRSLDRSAQAAFAARDYAKAADDWREAVKFSEGLEVERVFAARVTEAEILNASVESLASAIASAPKRFQRVDLGNGTIAKVRGLEDGRLVAEIRGLEERVALKAVPDRAFAELLVMGASSSVSRLGAATLFARSFDVDRAEALLAKVLADEPGAKPRVDQLLSALRKEDPGEGGYLLEGKRFVSSRELARRALSKEYEPKLRKMWSSEGAAREALFVELLADERARDVITDAFAQKRRALHEKFEKGKVGKDLAVLLHDRDALDERRKSALELIYDADKYFYPYKDREGEYRVVQMEVSRRCALVRDAWNLDTHRIAFGSGFAKELELYRFVSKSLVPLAGLVIGSDDKWFWSFASGTVTTIRNVARNQADREFLDKADAVLAENTKSYEEMRASGTASTDEVDLMVLTNAYRLQMGRMPLRVDARLVIAARGHCEEMSRLGYFGHESPVPERRTPSDRMRLAGYKRGAGENLAINNGPAGAIEAWQHSSGHHRNMLATQHRDLGGGIHGRHFNQNFGAGGG
ncbi:MAG: hypothetical protein H6832_19055 [Planctomycetes bacterium]|nr:hypothetical protein [Planctomycetota bacterium]MCB9920509.1 hypothetical protein [Planctomycetota bacterium]